jgi:hypothetical protein
MSIKVPERGLRIAFGIVLVLSGIKVAGVPQANYVIAVGLGIFAVVFLVWSIRQFFFRRVEAQESV